jgi:predicted phosphodiesterase
MKISVCSDIHLEFGPIELKNTDGADVLVLSGDICVSNDLYKFDETAKELGTSFAKSDAYHSFFQNCCKEFKHVVYVAGNHEHYHGDYATTMSNLKEQLGYLVNLHVLDKESVVLDGVPFFGGTLWTDMNKEDPLTLHSISGMMNDFRIVKNSNKQVTYRVDVALLDENGDKKLDENGRQLYQAEFRKRDAKFSPEDAVEDHKAYLTELNVFLNTFGTQKVVVVGHHAPSRQSTHPRYKDEQLMNGGYSSSLENLMLDNPNIKLWTHGHTHEDFDYMIGSTRIVCNPRGYINYEHRADVFELKTVEI